MSISIGYDQPALVWLDLETTGLDAHDGAILEVGVIITHLDLNEVSRNSWVMKYDRDDVLPMMDDYVLNMHLSSGLLKQVWGDRNQGEEVCEFRSRLDERNMRIWSAIKSFIVGQTSKVHNTYLAGSSIHFDRTWLSAHVGAEDILNLVSHRMVDVSLFKVAFPGLLVQPSGQAASHRALADLDYSIDQLAQMREKLCLCPSPTSEDVDHERVL